MGAKALKFEQDFPKKEKGFETLDDLCLLFYHRYAEFLRDKITSILKMLSRNRNRFPKLDVHDEIQDIGERRVRLWNLETLILDIMVSRSPTNDDHPRNPSPPTPAENGANLIN